MKNREQIEKFIRREVGDEIMKNPLIITEIENLIIKAGILGYCEGYKDAKDDAI